jgi:hypothetical protein
MSAEAQTLEIADCGRCCRVDYSSLMAYHGGGALFGATVAYRALQLAAHVLSGDRLWERNDLSIVSSHPGTGVTDAIEFVTRCVSRGRYEAADRTGACGSGMRFEWQIGSGAHTILVRLRDGFVPQRFFELAERKRTGVISANEQQALENLKADLSERLWEEPLEAVFELYWLEGLTRQARTGA